MTDFCTKLQELIDNAPNPQAKAALQAVFDNLCGATTNDSGGGGSGNPDD